MFYQVQHFLQHAWLTTCWSTSSVCTHFSGILNKQKTAEGLAKKGFKSDLWCRDWCSSVPLSKQLTGSRGGVGDLGVGVGVSKLKPNTHMVWRSARPSHRTICVKYDHIIREQVSRDSCKTQRGNYVRAVWGETCGNIQQMCFWGAPGVASAVCAKERGAADWETASKYWTQSSTKGLIIKNPFSFGSIGPPLHATAYALDVCLAVSASVCFVFGAKHLPSVTAAAVAQVIQTHLCLCVCVWLWGRDKKVSLDLSQLIKLIITALHWCEQQHWERVNTSWRAAMRS